MLLERKYLDGCTHGIDTICFTFLKLFSVCCVEMDGRGAVKAGRNPEAIVVAHISHDGGLD